MSPTRYDFSTFPPQANPRPPKKKSKTSTNKDAAGLFEESPFSPAYALSDESISSPIKLEPYSAFPPNEDKLDDCILESLEERYLKAERARSDPEGHWPKKKRWLESVYDRPLSPVDMQRYFEIMGGELLDARK